MGELFISTHHLQATISTAGAPLISDVCRPEKYDEFVRSVPTARWRDHTCVDDWIGEIGPEVPALTNLQRIVHAAAGADPSDAPEAAGLLAVSSGHAA